MKIHFPSLFFKLRDIKDQTVIEIKTLRQVGLWKIIKSKFKKKPEWKKTLPMQTIKRVQISIRSLKELCDKFQFQQGGNAYYFSKHDDFSALFQDIYLVFPEDSGIKITKRKGGIETPFAFEESTCKMHSHLSPSHKELILVHNLFYILNMGPRLYDVCEIEFQNGDIHVMYILQHIIGGIAPQEICEAFVKKIKDMQASNLIQLVNWNGYNDNDFICPSCNNNLIYDQNTLSAKYIDLQNFALRNGYSDFLKKLANEIVSISHFGQKTYLLGGAYLYQEIPGVELLGHRSSEPRIAMINDLLEKSNFTIKNKLIIDVGCNIGVMGAHYLKLKAAWLHGFDFETVVQCTEKILLAIGCSRFSLTGMSLNNKSLLLNHLPKHIQHLVSGCIISYLAIRGHINWIEELKFIPWEFMIYEGHEYEDFEMSQSFVKNLNEIVPCQIVAENWIIDANSSKRYLCIIKNLTYSSVSSDKIS